MENNVKKAVISSVIIGILLLLALMASCGAPEQTGVIRASIVSPPTLCVDGGGCPTGEACAPDGHCGPYCGENFVCPIGYYCSKGFPGHDCIPLCYRTDAGCF